MRQVLNQHVKWVFDAFFFWPLGWVVLAGVADVSLKISIFTKGYLSEWIPRGRWLCETRRLFFPCVCVSGCMNIWCCTHFHLFSSDSDWRCVCCTLCWCSGRTCQPVSPRRLKKNKKTFHPLCNRAGKRYFFKGGSVDFKMRKCGRQKNALDGKWPLRGYNVNLIT